MKITVDTREKPQAIQGILRTFTALGVEYEIKKLDTADYMNPENTKIIVDRKQNLNEVAMNLGNKKSRFYRECERAVAEGKKLVVLVEHGNAIKSLEDVARWQNPNYAEKALYMSGRELMERMHRVSVMYGVRWEFCGKRDTGRRIVEILQ